MQGEIQVFSKGGSWTMNLELEMSWRSQQGNTKGVAGKCVRGV